jgi:hypothetical protein
MQKKMDDEFDSEKSKLATLYWASKIQWRPKILKREITIKPFNDSLFTKWCFEKSFLFRITHHYQTYISRFTFDQDTRILTPPMAPKNSNRFKLANTLEIALEQSILLDYCVSFTAVCPGCLPFPSGPYDFLWNFFLFLSTQEVNLNRIKPLEVCDKVYLAFSTAITKSNLQAFTGEKESKKHLIVLSILLHADVTNKMHTLTTRNRT